MGDNDIERDVIVTLQYTIDDLRNTIIVQKQVINDLTLEKERLQVKINNLEKDLFYAQTTNKDTPIIEQPTNSGIINSIYSYIWRT